MDVKGSSATTVFAQPLRRGRDLIVLGINPWDDRWQRPQHFANDFVRRGSRVLQIDPYLTTGGGDWTLLEEDTRPDGVSLVRLGSLGIPLIHDIDRWTDDDVAHTYLTFGRMTRALEVEDPILMIQHPAWWPLVGAMLPKKGFPSVYDCLEEWKRGNSERGKLARAFELELASKANLVISTSTPLVRRMDKLAARVLHVSDGCDFEHFRSAVPPTGILRGSMRGPIIGFHGLMTFEDFDANLVAELARRRPDWNFALVGPVDEACSSFLDGIPNVVLTGSVPYRQLPKLTADFDVAVIPHRMNEQMLSAEHLKLYEYLAAGKPVVASPSEPNRQFGDLVAIAEDVDSFERAIARYLADPGDPIARQTVASRYTWPSRVDLFYDEMIALPARPPVRGSPSNESLGPPSLSGPPAGKRNGTSPTLASRQRT